MGKTRQLARGSHVTVRRLALATVSLSQQTGPLERQVCSSWRNQSPLAGLHGTGVSVAARGYWAQIVRWTTAPASRSSGRCRGTRWSRNPDGRGTPMVAEQGAVLTDSRRGRPWPRRPGVAGELFRLGRRTLGRSLLGIVASAERPSSWLQAQRDLSGGKLWRFGLIWMGTHRTSPVASAATREDAWSWCGQGFWASAALKPRNHRNWLTGKIR